MSRLVCVMCSTNYSSLSLRARILVEQIGVEFHEPRIALDLDGTPLADNEVIAAFERLLTS